MSRLSNNFTQLIKLQIYANLSSAGDPPALPKFLNLPGHFGTARSTSKPSLEFEFPRMLLAGTILLTLFLSMVLPLFAAPSSDLQAAYVKGSVLVEPSDLKWKSAVAVLMPLTYINEPEWSYKVESGAKNAASSPQVRPAAPPAPVGNITVKAIYNGSEIAFLLTWPDPSKNLAIETTEQFADAVSIAFDAPGNCHMGSFANPTSIWNVWYWRADLAGAENLIVAGMGSITRTPEKTITTLSSFGSSGWSVVFSRSLTASNSDNEVDLQQGNPAIRFARWNGAEQERDGRKWITNAIKLSLRPHS